jgi:transposase-like protein
VPVEADETWEGGLRKGEPGRPTVGEKALVAAAVEVNAKRGWGRARLASLEDGSSASLRPFLKQSVASGSTLRTDGWRYRSPAKELGLRHVPTEISVSESEAHELLPAVHRVFSLVHRIPLTTHQGAVSQKHLPRYLAEHELRFNRLPRAVEADPGGRSEADPGDARDRVVRSRLRAGLSTAWTKKRRGFARALRWSRSAISGGAHARLRGAVSPESAGARGAPLLSSRPMPT